MQEWLRISTAVALGWAIAACAWQVIRARRGRRPTLSRASGSAVRGVIYNFTVAMAPSHKESVRKHRIEFGVGVLLHLGTMLAIADVVLLVVAPSRAAVIGPWLAPLLAASVVAGAWLGLRRARSPVLGAMSSPDDFVAILVVTMLSAIATLHAIGRIGPDALLAVATALFVYVPLGKLRHAAFFFAVRAEFGHRMGHRGSYPVVSRRQSHAG